MCNPGNDREKHVCQENAAHNSPYADIPIPGTEVKTPLPDFQAPSGNTDASAMLFRRFDKTEAQLDAVSVELGDIAAHLNDNSLSSRVENLEASVKQLEILSELFEKNSRCDELKKRCDEYEKQAKTDRESHNNEKAQLLGQIQAINNELNLAAAAYDNKEKSLLEEINRFRGELMFNKQLLAKISTALKLPESRSGDELLEKIRQNNLTREAELNREKMKNTDLLRQIEDIGKENKQLNDNIARLQTTATLYEAYLLGVNKLPDDLKNRCALDFSCFEAFLSSGLQRRFPEDYYGNVSAWIYQKVNSGADINASKPAADIANSIFLSLYEFGRNYFENKHIHLLAAELGGNANPESCIFLNTGGGNRICEIWLYGLSVNGATLKNIVRGEYNNV